MKTSNSFNGLRTFCAALVILVGAPILRGQSAHTCDEAKPFTAQMIEHIVTRQPDGAERKAEFVGVRARDSRGRVYAELRFEIEEPKKQTQSTGNSEIHFGHENSPVFRSSVSISDCRNGEETTVAPDLKVARVTKNSNASSWKRNDSVSLFDFLTSGPRPPNVIFEELGFKKVEGISTHGYRETILGTEDDGEWNGKTSNVMESWISDDLAEIILQALTNVKGRTETTVMLTGIKREEPPASLFEIPPGYKVDVPTNDKQPSDTKIEPTSGQ